MGNLQQRMITSAARIKALDPLQMKIVTAEILGDRELDDTTRRDLVGQTILSVARDRPQAALAHFTEVSDLLIQYAMGRGDRFEFTGCMGQGRSHAALEWFHRMPGNFLMTSSTSAKQRMIKRGTQDPGLAFKLSVELVSKSSDYSVETIIRAAGYA